MSEELNQADTVQAPAEVEGQTATTEEGKVNETAKAEEKVDPMTLVPKKYRNEDGTVDMERFVKGHLALDKMIGKKGNVAANAVEDYEFQFGEGFEIDEEKTNAFKAEALSKGFSKEQYAFIMEKYAGQVQAMAQAQAESAWTAEKVEAKLKESWGSDYQENLKAAGRAFNAMADDDDDLADPIWNHPSVMKMMARFGSELGEDSVSQRKAVSKTAGISREEIEALQRSDQYMKGDAEAHKKVSDWYAKNIK